MRLIALLTAALAMSCQVRNLKIPKPVTAELLYTVAGEPILLTGAALPLMVYSEDELLIDTVHATYDWNQWMGATVFGITADPIEADIVVFGGGDPYIDENGMRIVGECMFPVVPDDLRHMFRFGHVPTIAIYANRGWTLHHELGHAIGLAHDNDNPSSVMCQSYYSRDDAAVGLEPVDRAILHQAYAIEL
jgi:predicted Zn-dependent protease